MKDPKPLVGEGATDSERRWLSAARAEEPPPEVVDRIERALGLAIAVPATTAPPAAASTAAAKPGLSARRIARLSALGAVVVLGLVLLLARPAPSTPAVAPVADRPPPAESVPAASAPAAESVAAVGAPAAESVTVARARAVAAPPAAPAAESERTKVAGAGALRDEIALIDGARAALAAGSPVQALSLLDRYRARHPRGMLLPEALAIRIEAIDRNGEHAQARALARAFLAEYPRSPLAQRLTHLATLEQK